MKIRSILMLFVMALVAHGSGQTLPVVHSERYGSLDYVLMPNVVHVLMPARTIQTPLQLPTEVVWAEETSDLFILGTPVTSSSQSFAELVGQIVDPQVTAVTHLAPGKLVAKEIYRLNKEDEGLSITTIPKSKFCILSIFGEKSRVVLVNLQTGAATVTDLEWFTQAAIFVSKNGLSVARLDSILESNFQTNEARYVIQAYQLDLVSGVWDRIPDFNPPSLGAYSRLRIPGSDNVAILYRDKSEKEGSTLIFDISKGTIIDRKPFAYSDQLSNDLFEARINDVWNIETGETKESGSKTPQDLLMITGKRDEARPNIPVPEFRLVGVTDGALSPDFKTFAFIQGNLVGLRELRTLKAEEFSVLAENSEKRELLEQADWISSAISKYSEANDGKFPPADSIRLALAPYLNYPEYLERFHYQVPNLTRSADDESPQQIGFIEGEYGKVILFIDGSSQWQSKKG
jgi:hypothetical protein